MLVNVDELQKVVADPKRVKVQPQEPPSILKATRPPLLLLLPPPPPSATSDTIQMLSAKKGEDARKIGQIYTFDPIVQVTGTPPIILIDQGKSNKEKEDTKKDEEKAAIQTLIELPKIGTPTQTL